MRELERQKNRRGVLGYYVKEYDRLGIYYYDRAILNIRADLYYPLAGDMTPEIRLYSEGTDFPKVIGDISVCRPHTNKDIITARQRVARKNTTKFIPILYESIEHIKKLNRIEIIWTSASGDYVIMSDCFVKVTNPAENGIYSYYTYEEWDSSKMLNNVNNHLESRSTGSVYDSFYDIRAENGRLSCMGLHGDKSDFRTNFAAYDLPPSVLHSPYYDRIKSAEENFTLQYYYSKAELRDTEVIPL